MSKTLRMFNGDIFISQRNGRGEEISKEVKCTQDLAETLMTPYDGTRDYGSELTFIDAPPQFSGLVGPGLVSKKIDEAVQRLKQSQLRDQYSDSDERINSITRLDVNALSITDFFFVLQVKTESGKVSDESAMVVHLGHQINEAAINVLQNATMGKGKVVGI